VPKRVTATLENARRLAVVKQHLAGKTTKNPSSSDILELVRNIGCLQLDPISAVAPSHQIVLWSRLGNYDTSHLDSLLWKEKKLFEYWAHQASIVLMEDYPLYYYMMRNYPESRFAPQSIWLLRVKKWLNANADVRDYVLTELKRKGPLLSRQFEDESRSRKPSDGWSSWGNVSRMLLNLIFKGEIMVVGRQGKQKIYDLSERFLPSWVSKKELSEEEIEYEAVQRSIKALGTATESEIKWYFLRGRYRNLKDTLKRLQADSKIHPVDIREGPIGIGKRYIHSEDIQTLEDIDSNNWEPRVSFLSPFGNLISDRTRTKLLFNFDYLTEIYTPENKRKYGYYVLPILYGDKLVGRIDPLMDRKNQKLLINAVHAEPHALKDKNLSGEIRDTAEQLSEFLGAKEVVYSRKVPKPWRNHLH